MQCSFSVVNVININLRVHVFSISSSSASLDLQCRISSTVHRDMEIVLYDLPLQSGSITTYCLKFIEYVVTFIHSASSANARVLERSLKVWLPC